MYLKFATMLSFARPNSTGKGAKGAEDLIAYSDSVSSNSWPDEAMTREFAREPFSIIENSITVVPLSPRMKASSGYDHLSSIFLLSEPDTGSTSYPCCQDLSYLRRYFR